MTPDRPVRILLVDDNEAGRYVKSRLLRQAGWLVTESGEGEAAVRIASAIEHDLAVLDVQLPDEHGFNVCRRLKSLQPEIMVLLTSASFTLPGSRSAGLDSGADAYLVEPAEEVELLAQVRALLRMRATERKLRDAEQRLEMALRASSTGVWDWDLGTDQIEWSRELKAVLGVEANELPSAAFFELVHSDDRERVREAMTTAMSSLKPYEAEYRVDAADGVTRWVSDRGCAVSDVMGTPRRMLGTIRDITAQKESERAVRESEERLRLAIDAASILAFEWSLDTDRVVRIEPEDTSDIGVTSAQIGETGAQFFGQIDGRDRQRVLDLMAALTPDRADFTTDFRMRNGSGRLMWMHSAGRGEFADDGRLRRLHGVIRNITNQKQREEQVQFLMREVNHRSKNMLSLVLAVARQTVSQERDDFVRRFEERIQSLALCQDLLVKSDWAGVPIGDLVHSQLAHFKDLIGRRIEIDGVHLDLSASAAQTLGMAVHELATNAGKYGALSNGVGRVVIQWRVDDHRAEQPGFELSWSEVDGPKVEMPLRKGFGSKVIGNMVRLGLGGDAETDYAETGLRWRLRCPVQNVVVSETPHVSVLGNIHQSYDDHVLREDNPSI